MVEGLLGPLHPQAEAPGNSRRWTVLRGSRKTCMMPHPSQDWDASVPRLVRPGGLV